jgi:hypothetical protein
MWIRIRIRNTAIKLKLFLIADEVNSYNAGIRILITGPDSETLMNSYALSEFATQHGSASTYVDQLHG